VILLVKKVGVCNPSSSALLVADDALADAGGALAYRRSAQNLAKGRAGGVDVSEQWSGRGRVVRRRWCSDGEGDRVVRAGAQGAVTRVVVGEGEALLAEAVDQVGGLLR
jgi:hypothetical protein